ncbi:MAG TPA: HTTM domain-containing protein [Pirellulales bacterium]|jgi:hypothetical protein|nr:HTTM domain-containing protein [Pirellulales bacterium]
MPAIRSYFDTLARRFGESWNRFWFTPSDPFTLGMIRVLTAIVALGLYLSCIPDLERWFGPDGLLPENAVLHLRDAKVFSAFDYANSTSSLWALFWIGAAALALFLVGLFTRVTAVVALFAVLSLIHRGPMLARPVDDIVAMLMFYLCLGPCGAALSLDSWRDRRKTAAAETAPRQCWGATVVVRLMQVHLSVIYFMMAMAKLRSPVWLAGRAVWGLIVKPESRLLDLTGLANHMYVINLWTLAIVLFELCFAFLIWNRMARPLLLGLSLPIWIGTALLTGMTSWVLMMLVANLAFVSPDCLRNCFERRTTSA